MKVDAKIPIIGGAVLVLWTALKGGKWKDIFKPKGLKKEKKDKRPWR